MNRYTVFSIVLFSMSGLIQADGLALTAEEDAQATVESESSVLSTEILSAQERTVVSLLTSVMDIVNGRIDADSCFELSGWYPVTLYATGVGGQRRQNNMVTVGLPTHPVSVAGYPKSTVSGIGSRILTGYTRTSNYNDFDPVKGYVASYSFNSTGEMSEMTGYLDLLDWFLGEQAYKSEAIMNISYSSLSEQVNEYATNVGWGMSRLSNPEYPQYKYWQRIKNIRDDGTNAHTIMVRDLLAEGIPCRVKIDVSGHNSTDYMSLDGFLTIEMANPTDPVGVSFN
jgi:hypothetical protein